jgi:hypothetical protein
MEELTKIEKNELPHQEWLDDNSDYLKQNPLPLEMRRKVTIANAQYAKYQKAQGDEASARALDGCMKVSFTVADALQTWKERDYEEEQPEAQQPEEKNDKKDTQSQNNNQNTVKSNNPVQIIDGKSVESKNEQKPTKVEEEPVEEENSGNAGKVVATVVGIGIIGWLASKLFRR